MTKQNLVPTVIAVVIGLAGMLLVLFAWHLPPFSYSAPTTENAYLRGKVTPIAPQLSGYLQSVDVADFQVVKKGDVIATIDDRIYAQKLAQAEAALAGAQATLQISEQSIRSAEAVQRADQAALTAAESARDTAQTTYDRLKRLIESGATSQALTDQSELSLAKAKADVLKAHAQLDVQAENINSARVQLAVRNADIASAEAAVALARIDLQNTVVRAPENGRLGQVSARVGQYVTPGSTLVSHVGQDLWVIANFKETELHGIRPGDQATFKVDAMDGRVFTGKVSSYSPATASEFSVLQGQNATGNFTKIAQRLPIRIDLDPGQKDMNLLVPGLSVEAQVATR